MTKSRTRVIRFRVNEDEQKLIDRLHERYSDFHGDTSKLIRALIEDAALDKTKEMK